LDRRSEVDQELLQSNGVPVTKVTKSQEKKGLAFLLGETKTSQTTKSTAVIAEQTDQQLYAALQVKYAGSDNQQLEALMRAIMERDKDKHTSYADLERDAWIRTMKLIGRNESKQRALTQAKLTLKRHNETGRGYYKDVQKAVSVLHRERRNNAKKKKEARYAARTQESKERAVKATAALNTAALGTAALGTAPPAAMP
jgi:hypothetical protein